MKDVTARSCCSKARSVAPLHDLLGKTLLVVRSSPDARKVRWSVDVDPIEL